MTDASDILANLERDPDSEILAAMLTDALMEERGMFRSEADRHVERVRTDARTAKQIEFTAALIKAKGPAHDELVREVERICQESDPRGYTLYVVAGDGPPMWTHPIPGRPDVPIGPRRSIALPAGWVCAWFKLHTFPIHPVRVQRRRK